MKIAFNFAHNRFLLPQEVNTLTAYKIGMVDKVYQFRDSDIDNNFKKKNSFIFSQVKGYGMWLWKYYFTNKLLNDDSIPENSYIIYSDSGCYYIDSVDKLIEVMERDNQSVMTFRQNHKSSVFTKRDAFILMECDSPEYTDTGQRCGGWYIVKKNDFGREFFKWALIYGQDARILTEIPSEIEPNYPDFKFHLHDESLTSLLSKKYNLYPYRNPSQHGFIDDINWTHNKYGEEGLKEMVDRYGAISGWLNKYGLYFHGETLNQYPPIHIDDKSTYPQIFHLHRNSNLTSLEPEHKHLLP